MDTDHDDVELTLDLEPEPDPDAPVPEAAGDPAAEACGNVPKTGALDNLGLVGGGRNPVCGEPQIK